MQVDGSSIRPANENTMSKPTDDGSDTPPLPENWERCHAYNERKRRYCRQMPVPLSGKSSGGTTANQPRYCGNHRHLMDEWLLANYGQNLASDDGEIISRDEMSNKVKRPRTNSPTEGSGSNNINRKDRGKRVPCPIDRSHMIYESAISKHVLVCPAVTEKQEVANKEYYCEGINFGGFGDLGSVGSESKKKGVDLGDAKELARAVLRVFHFLFIADANGSKMGTLDLKGNQLSEQELQNITYQEIYNGLPEVDLSKVEEGTSNADVQSSDHEAKQTTDTKLSTKANTGRLTNAITKHRIKAGGAKHLHQIASILGHVRQKGFMSTMNESETKNSPLIIEMGAGRGMTGLIVAGAMAASLAQHANPSTKKVRLCLVERSGTRGKAETKVRTASERTTDSKEDDCLRLDQVEVTRVKCDLAHVDMSKALPHELRSNSSKTVVIAKHLCGAGIDLALKSLRNAGATIDGCVMATCCHGLCTWTEYVGRDCLIRLFCISEVGGLASFGEKEFNLLKRWTSASVLEDRPAVSEAADSIIKTDGNEMKEDEHNVSLAEEEETGKYPSINIFEVVKELGLACGGNGLGRACQRLIDYGRCDYMRNNLFPSVSSGGSSSNNGAFDVSMCHYCSKDVTPQNALLVASR